MRVETSAAFTQRIASSVTVMAQPAQQSEDGAAKPAEEGVKVSISSVGLARSEASAKNSDIDESDLPSTVKQLLKLIRELKAQLAEKMAQLQALMAQQDLDAETRQMRAQALQTEVSSLSGALSSANAQLVKVMREEGLSAEQGATLASLM